jgi:hypothetical protein
VGFVAEEKYPDVVVTAGETPAEQRWTVSAGGRIRGTVRASSGTPVANASLLATRQSAEGNRPSGDGGYAGTDADGRFEVAGLRAGTFEVSVVAPGQPAMNEPVLVTLSEGGDATVDIRLEAGGDLLGDVVDEKGHPVAGITLQAQAETSGRPGHRMECRRWTSVARPRLPTTAASRFGDSDRGPTASPHRAAAVSSQSACARRGSPQRAQRTPVSSSSSTGSSPSRCQAGSSSAASLNEPPRTTRSLPAGGPIGSRCGLSA